MTSLAFLSLLLVTVTVSSVSGQGKGNRNYLCMWFFFLVFVLFQMCLRLWELWEINDDHCNNEVVSFFQRWDRKLLSTYFKYSSPQRVSEELPWSVSTVMLSTRSGVSQQQYSVSDSLLLSDLGSFHTKKVEHFNNCVLEVSAARISGLITNFHRTS